MKYSFMFVFGLAGVCACSAFAGEISRAELERALDKNPDLITNVLRKDKALLLQIVNEAAQEDQARQQKEAEEAEIRDFEESFKNPKAAKIDSASHVQGPADAVYTLVVYADFQCPYCANGYKTVEELKKKYSGRIRVVYKNMPLSFHDQAMPAAQWFEAVAMQSADKAFKFADLVYQNQEKLGGTFLKDAARKLGVKIPQAEKDAASQAVKDRIEADMMEAQEFGFSGTPGFLLNGIPIRGAYPIERFEEIIAKIDAAKK